MKTIEEFIDNLTSEDVDLYNKLDNLCGHAQITDTIYKMASVQTYFEYIEDNVIEILQDSFNCSKRTEKYIAFIKEETQNLFEQKLIKEPDDFTSGLYNCDNLYLYAISRALDIDMEDLDTYEDYDYVNAEGFED